MARSRRGVGAAAMVAVCLLVGACTPSSGETPSPTPLPSTSPTPTENSVERQERLDYAAAEKSYREFQDELRRVLRAGGATNATRVMLETTGGPFLDETEGIVKSYKSKGYHQKGVQRVISVHGVGHSANQVLMEICEDGRAVTTIDRNNRSIGSNDLRRSEVTFRKVSGQWKMWAADGRKVSECD